MPLLAQSYRLGMSACRSEIGDRADIIIEGAKGLPRQGREGLTAAAASITMHHAAQRPIEGALSRDLPGDRVVTVAQQPQVF